MTQHRSEVRDGMRVDWDVPIPMEDGTVLRADVFRPTDDGRHPVIMTHGPYAKGLEFAEGYPGMWEPLSTKYPDAVAGSTNKYQNWETADPEKWVPDGYVCIRVDSRGAGRSPGHLDIFSAQETRDYYECIEWAGTQAWSNGKVGLLGISYYAVNQWQVAALRPPHLAAICPWEGASDHYREFTHHGGILNVFTSVWYPVQVSAVQHGVGERGARNPNTGEPVAGPDTLAGRGTRRPPHRFGGRTARPPLLRRVLPRALSGAGEDHRPGAVGGQLGARPAHPRQLREPRPRLLGTQVAGSPRPRALRRVLHRLRRRAAEAVLRTLPRRRGHRLGPAAARAAQRPTRRRQLRAARGARVAARPDRVDHAAPGPAEPDADR